MSIHILICFSELFGLYFKLFHAHLFYRHLFFQIVCRQILTSYFILVFLHLAFLQPHCYTLITYLKFRFSIHREVILS